MRISNVVLCTLLLLGGCGGAPAPQLGLNDGHLLECPQSPNCVSSDSLDPDHRIEAFSLAAGAPSQWQAVQAAVSAMPRARITDAHADYIRLEFTSAILGFVDDVELHWRPAQGKMAVRSASRVGYSDLGVNRRRVEQMRALLKQRGLVR